MITLKLSALFEYQPGRHCKILTIYVQNDKILKITGFLLVPKRKFRRKMTIIRIALFAVVLIGATGLVWKIAPSKSKLLILRQLSTNARWKVWSMSEFHPKLTKRRLPVKKFRKKSELTSNPQWMKPNGVVNNRLKKSKPDSHLTIGLFSYGLMSSITKH